MLMMRRMEVILLLLLLQGMMVMILVQIQFGTGPCLVGLRLHGLCPRGSGCGGGRRGQLVGVLLNRRPNAAERKRKETGRERERGNRLFSN